MSADLWRIEYSKEDIVIKMNIVVKEGGSILSIVKDLISFGTLFKLEWQSKVEILG
jgi:hypothetical protein